MIGIIGGSGFDDPSIFSAERIIVAQTPFGIPSSRLIMGKMKGIDAVFLARHGTEHTIPPTHVNFRANIFALKDAGCTHIIATTACGSLRKDIQRGDLVIPDQFIDFTRLRPVSFYEKFEPHKPVHTSMAEPFSKELRTVLIKGAEELGLRHHKSGTIVTIEGARFSTKAESRMFRMLGADVINMSTAPEAILANEAGIPYAAIAMSTDYDCLFDDVPPVTWEEILRIFKDNAEKVTSLIVAAVPRIK